MPKHLNLSLVLGSLALVFSLTACGGGPKPQTDGGEAAAVQEEQPKMTESQAEKRVSSVQDEAMGLEKSNNQLRQQIFELKTSMGMEVDNGQEPVAEPKPQAEAKSAAKEEAKPAQAAKKPVTTKKKK
jgi:hypothetical protein